MITEEELGGAVNAWSKEGMILNEAQTILGGIVKEDETEREI